MTKTLQNILVKKNYYILPKLERKMDKSEEMTNALALVKSTLNSIGFDLPESSYKLLSKANLLDLKIWYLDFVSALKSLKGDDVKHIKFYGNFPDFDNMSELEVVVRQICSYLTFSDKSMGIGATEDTQNTPLKDETKVILIKLVSKEEADNILKEYGKNYLSSKSAIPESIKPEIKELFNEYRFDIIPEEFNFKETMVFVVKELLGGFAALELFDLKFIKTVTDVLRLYAVLSDCSAELDEVKFCSLKRAQRRWFMDKLEKIITNSKTSYVDDFARHKFLWLRAAEYLHVGEYALRAPKAYKAISNLRNNNYKTWNSKFEELYQAGNEAALKHLQQKPGEFARKLDMLLRKDTFKADTVLKYFSEVGTKVSIPVLLQLYKLFSNRNKEPLFKGNEFKKKRVFKVSQLKTYSVEDDREEISSDTIEKVLTIVKESIKGILSKRESLGKVYLSEEMKNFMIPENNRTAGAGFRVLTTGSRLAIPENKNILRIFTHWKNAGGHSVDIDLSAHAIIGDNDKNFKVQSLDWMAWNNWRDFDGYHSGDVRSAPNGASEFIDVNLEKAKAANVRYIVVFNNSYSGQKYIDIPECFAGYMLREGDGRTGKTFDARTVETKFSLLSETGREVPFIVDVVNREIIWCDLSATYDGSFSIARHDLCLALDMLYKTIETRMSMYDLALLQNCTFVDNPEDADIKIGTMEDADITPYDLEKWTTLFM